ncbi:hypothetical protein LTR08_007168 [Meristemomyces frigidus]|nr:hypothetical protein LTR08_007168 [Meristemomyces frigidus]
MSSRPNEPENALKEKDVLHSEVLDSPELMNTAFDGENREHEMGILEAVKSYPWACLWAFIFCFTIVMESFDMFLNGNFVALAAFQRRFGVFVGASSPSGYAIPTKWQSALFQSGQCGAFIGVFLAGPITNRIGYRWTTIVGLILMNATVFVSFFTPLLILVFLAPESPWWLIRHGRKEQALRSVTRLGRGRKSEDQDTFAMMERTVEIELAHGGAPSLLDLVKGTDLRRTIITCLIYASQNFAGNLIANQATFFFEQAGMTANFAFQLNMINSVLQFVANAGSWFLTAWFCRRTIFLWGAATNITLLFILGICASVPQNHQTNYAQACLGVIISFVFAGSLGPISYSIIAETSSIRLRALSTGVGRAAYYVAEIPMIYLASQMLNPTGWNLAGKCGYVWGSTAVVCWLMAFFFLPELKHRSYREIDILFARKVPARKFRSTVIDVKDNE